MVSTITAKDIQLAEEFRKVIAGETNAAMQQLRSDAFASFELHGYPTVRNEEWKYTNVAAIAAEKWNIAEGNFGEISTDGLQVLEKFRKDRNGFTALNLAFADVQIIRIAKDVSVDEPIEFSFGGEDGVAAFPHIIVIAEPGSKATLVETYASTASSFTNTAIQIVVGDNAHITHYRIQKDSPEAFHYGMTEVSVGRAASYNSTNINLGGSLSRHDIEVTFTAEGGEAWVDGLYMLNGTQHHDTHSIIDHAVPNCLSHQTYKGVMNDKSRAVFNGKVFVRENAHGTDAQQSNKNLLLSNEARVDTKPQLEIFNDDVKCSHGATVGQLEEEELFYLLTRGLPETLARNLLTYGFAEAVIEKIGIESIKQELDRTVLNRLNTEI
jgi:Fe-S cluster assembly protein SufD